MKGSGDGQFENWHLAVKSRAKCGENVTERPKNKKADKLWFVGLLGFSPPPPLLQPIRLFGIIN